MLTLVVAMTAGCRAVLLATTAFWLAGRRLLKACIYRDGVLVFRQEGTSDRPLPVSISGARSHGPSVGCRSGFLASPGFTRWALHRSNRYGVLLFSKLLSRLHLACADFVLGHVDLHVEMASSRPFNRCARRRCWLGERRQQAGCVAVAALLTEWRAALASQLACTQTRVALTPALAHLCAVLAVYSRSCGPAADTGAPVAGLYRRGAACTGGAATRGSAHGPLRLPLRLGRVWRTCSRQGILRTRWLDPRSNKLYVELSRRPVRGKFGVRRHTVS